MRRDVIRLGVIGLGRLWEARHKPALARVRDQARVVAVHDQVLRRAEVEARSLGCAACEGLRALIGRDDVDAVLVLTPQWFGAHPIGIAAEAGKPIYSALPPGGEPEALEALAERIRASGAPFMPELARRFYPATIRLRELVASTLGPITSILGQARVSGFDRYGAPGPSTQLAPAPLAIDPGGFLLDWCRFVFDREPSRVRATEASAAKLDGPDHLGLNLEFGDGRFAQVTVDRMPPGDEADLSRTLPPPGFHVVAERGSAWVEMPDRIVWKDEHGMYDEHLPSEPTVGDRLITQFLRFVRGEPSTAPGLDDLLAVLRLDREMRDSLRPD